MRPFARSGASTDSVCQYSRPARPSCLACSPMGISLARRRLDAAVVRPHGGMSVRGVAIRSPCGGLNTMGREPLRYYLAR